MKYYKPIRIELDKPSNPLNMIILQMVSKLSSVHNHQLTKETTSVPKIAVGLLLGILLFGMFMVGFDQGHLFSIAQDEQAYKDL
jgi:hypothetical protein